MVLMVQQTASEVAYDEMRCELTLVFFRATLILPIRPSSLQSVCISPCLSTTTDDDLAEQNEICDDVWQ